MGVKSFQWLFCFPVSGYYRLTKFLEKIYIPHYYIWYIIWRYLIESCNQYLGITYAGIGGMGHLWRIDEKPKLERYNENSVDSSCPDIRYIRSSGLLPVREEKMSGPVLCDWFPAILFLFLVSDAGKETLTNWFQPGFSFLENTAYPVFRPEITFSINPGLDFISLECSSISIERNCKWRGAEMTVFQMEVFQ